MTSSVIACCRPAAFIDGFAEGFAIVLGPFIKTNTSSSSTVWLQLVTEPTLYSAGMMKLRSRLSAPGQRRRRTGG